MLVAFKKVWFKFCCCYRGIKWANKFHLSEHRFKRCNNAPMDLHLNKLIELPMLPTLWNTLLSKMIKETIEGISIPFYIPLKLRS